MSEVIVQLLINIIVASSMYALVATGYTLIQGVLKFINFQHGTTVALGAFAVYFFYVQLSIDFFVSSILSIFLVGMTGALIERIAYKPLRKADPMNPLITSLGVAFFLQSIILIIWGPWVKTYGFPVERAFIFFGANITRIQVYIILASVSLLISLHLFVTKTKMGKAMRAVADNLDVASILGINTHRVITYVFILASSLGAMSGILIGCTQPLLPTMGIPIVIKTIAAAILGGIGNIVGAIVGSVVIAAAEVFGSWLLTPGYKDAFAYAILIIILLVRPTGLFGEKQ